MRLAQHAHELAKAWDVYLVETAGLPLSDASVMYYPNGFRVVRVPPIVGDIVYAVALHEIGHRASATGQLRAQMTRTARMFKRPITPDDMRLELEEELSAWAWAEHYALVWTAAMEEVKEHGLRTYGSKVVEVHHAFRMSDHPTVKALARRCWPKEQHATRGAAEAQLRSIVRRALEKDAERIHVYECPHCRTWHVGHRRQE